MAETSNQKALPSLADEGYISLETFKRSGDGVKTPVWHLVMDEKIYVFTEAEAFKVKRLRRDSRLRVAACGMGGAVHGTWYDGQGSIVTDAQLEHRVYKALRDKYGWQMRIADTLSSFVGRIHGRAVLEITLD